MSVAGQPSREGAHPDDSDPYNGYDWHGDGWVPGLITLETWFTPAPLLSDGAAVFYAPGLMEATARQRRLPLAGYLGGVAMLSPADIGRTVWLKRASQDWEGPYLVVDCARRGDMYGTAILRGEVVEVGFSTALRWGMIRLKPGGWSTVRWREEGVQVIVTNRRPDGASLPSPIRYAAWFKGMARFAIRATEPVYWPLAIGPGRWRWTDGRTITFREMYAQPWVNPADYRWPDLPGGCTRREAIGQLLCE